MSNSAKPTPATDASIPPRLLRAYQQTRYEAAGCVLRIGRRCPDAVFAHLHARTGALITAWNPFSQRMPDRWNQRMQRALADRLRRHPTRSATGSLHHWREAHLLVVADPRFVLRIARCFRQRGIVILRRGQQVRLALLPGSHGAA